MHRTNNCEFPLTDSQMEILRACRLDDRNPAYSVEFCIDIQGGIDVNVLRKSIQMSFLEVDSLNVEIVQDATSASLLGARQVQNKEQSVSLPQIIHLIHSSEGRSWQETARRWIFENVSTPIDICSGTLYENYILLLADEFVCWYGRAHHIGVDGYGLSLVASRVSEVYTAISSGVQVPDRWFLGLREVVFSEKEYKSLRMGSDRKFWIDRMQQAPRNLSFKATIGVASHRSNRSSHDISNRKSEIRSRAARLNVQWPAVIYALVARLVGARRGYQDVILGAPIMGRNGPLALSPATLVNVAPFRVSLIGLEDFDSLIRLCDIELKRVQIHGRYRSEQLRRDLGFNQTESTYGPIVNIMPFGYCYEFGESDAVMEVLTAGAVEDIIFGFHDHVDGKLVVTIDGNPAIYDFNEVEDIGSELLSLMDNVIMGDQDKL